MVQPEPNPPNPLPPEQGSPPGTPPRINEVPTPVVVQPKVVRTVLVPVISLPVELVKAGLGAIAVGLPVFVSTLSVTNVTDVKALEAAGLTAALVGAGFFSKSFQNWYNQKYGS